MTEISLIVTLNNQLNSTQKQLTLALFDQCNPETLRKNEVFQADGI